MAKYTRKEFLELLGKDPVKDRNWLAVYLQRKNIIEENGLIDDRNDKNKAWLVKYWQKHPELKGIKPAVQVVNDPELLDVPARKAARQRVMADTDDEDEDGGDFDIDSDEIPTTHTALDKGLKQVTFKKIREDARYRKHQADKIEGVTIPTEAVKMLFPMFTKALGAAFEQAAENMLTDIAKKYKMNKEDLAYFRSQLKTIINEAVEEGVTEAERGIDNILDEFADKRGRGEKKS